MGEMQRRLRKAEEVLRRTVEVDRTEVAEAFSTAIESSLTAEAYRRSIGLAGVLLLLGLGYLVSRHILEALSTLSSGLTRFSTGDFREPVTLKAQDELGDVAREANTMARSLQELAAARD